MAHDTTVIRIRKNLKEQVGALAAAERRSFTEELSILIEEALHLRWQRERIDEAARALPFELRGNGFPAAPIAQDSAEAE